MIIYMIYVHTFKIKNCLFFYNIKNMYSKVEEHSSKTLNEFYRQKIQHNEVLKVI